MVLRMFYVLETERSFFESRKNIVASQTEFSFQSTCSLITMYSVSAALISYSLANSLARLGSFI